MATVTDQDLITRTVYDYFECWYGKDLMLQATAEGNGTKVAAGRRLDVRIGDVCDDIASVAVRPAPYRECLHLARRPDGWTIANAQWLPW